MHVTVSWDISATGTKWTEINNEMKGTLQGYSWVRPLKSLYVVKVDSPEERGELKDALISIIKKNKDRKIHLLITPLMQGGSYTGWLPKSLWEKLDQRTK